MKVSTPQYIDVFKEEFHNKTFFRTSALDESQDIMLRKSPLTKAPASVDNNECMFVKSKVRLNRLLDKIHSNAEKKIKSLTDEQKDSLQLNYISRASMIHSILPKTSIQEVFGSSTEATQSFEKFKEKTKNLFNLADWQFEVYDLHRVGGNQLAFAKHLLSDNEIRIISTIIPDLNNNLQFLIDFMTQNGYYMIRCYCGEDVVRIDSPVQEYAKMINVCFAAVKPDDISSIVRMNRYLYHITSEENVKTIMQNGLLIQRRESPYDIRNTDIHYPARTYFYFGMSSAEAVQYAKNDMLPGKYHVLRIDATKLPENQPVYYDPLLFGNSIYIETDIPAQFIEDIATFEVN